MTGLSTGCINMGRGTRQNAYPHEVYKFCFAEIVCASNQIGESKIVSKAGKEKWKKIRHPYMTVEK